MLTIFPFLVIDDKYKTARVEMVNKLRTTSTTLALDKEIKHTEIEGSLRVI